MTVAISARNSHLAPSPRGIGADKVKKNGWVMVDDPGEFRMLNKILLKVDPEYQRGQNESKIIAIASSWSWMACGTLSVALRDGEYMVYDGSHRAAAACRRSDITHLPCLVFETNTVREEARAFMDTNTLRKPVDAIDKFKAETVIGVPATLAVAEMLAKSGYYVAGHRGSGNSREVKCIRSLTTLMETNADVLRSVWELVVEQAGEDGIHERIIRGAFYIEDRLRSRGQSLSEAPWRGRFIALGRAGAVAAIHKATAYYATGGAKVWASGLLEALNKGCRYRLSID